MTASTDQQTTLFRAPARVNLLGEHTDYSGGWVLPIAISYYTQVRISPSVDGRYSFRSLQFEGVAEGDLHTLKTRHHTWSDYPVGVLQELAKLGIAPPPFAMEVSGNVPLGAGLSSSASIEVASCMAMLRLSGSSMTDAEIALLCQRAENLFVESPCGIMDQFVVTAGTEGHALLLQTRDLTYELVPVTTGALAGLSIVACNSMVKHSVATGDYGSRRKGVEAGQQVLRETFPGLRDLGDATVQQLEQCRDNMSHEAYKRCFHVITENARVLSAREALMAGDAKRFGELMLASHISQRDEFEDSCEEIDFLVDTAMAQPGCLGARLTGGGFGGCTVNLVKKDEVPAFSRAIIRAYQARYGIDPEIYLCDAVDGAVELAAKENA
ncbi:galactokinase [Terriglobus tenax]|uniref:galactokinase n=1 Tax=Terriglobus tenax TaxID=1111115 RepID=UPI0021E098CB|nr:galactokinase [Terriglobus tenax]